MIAGYDPRIFLGLGTNLGDREANLVQAKDLLMKKGVMVVGQSEVRETKPMYDAPQPDYLNQVVECRSNLEPVELLMACEAVEKEMGRDMKRKGIGESRVIDIDILFYDTEVVVAPRLDIPHRGTFNRRFFLEGMNDLAPDFVHPLVKEEIRDMLINLKS